jgi:hypothetical protein
MHSLDQESPGFHRAVASLTLHSLDSGEGRYHLSGTPSGRSRRLPLRTRPPADYDALPPAGAGGLQVVGFIEHLGHQHRGNKP